MNFVLQCLVTFIFLILSRIDFTAGHPQCLDFLPPFENQSPNYCSEYHPNSCCTTDAASDIERTVDAFLENSPVRRKVKERCAPYLRNVTCTTCSPYAAHVYEAENAAVPRVFPSLCYDYCLEFYNKCYPLLFDYYNLDITGYKRKKRSARRFCRRNISQDPTYCYPTVIRGPAINDTQTNPNCDLAICAQPIAINLRNPVVCVHSNDQTGRLFIVEQIGVILVVTKDGELLSTPFLDISGKVLTSRFNGDERGLLGLVFHPDFKNNCKFYVYYSTRSRRLFDDDGNYISHVSHVSQFIAIGCGNIANASSEVIIMIIPQPEGNHNGGQLLFGENGCLLIFLGDGGGGGDRHGTIGHGLDRSTLLGAILCINITTLPYTIPEDNPFVNQPPIRPEVYAYGLRNPWRCSFDRGDPVNGDGKGRLFCGDVGQNAFEEINVIVKGGNYGWRAFEGITCFDRRLCNRNDTIFPIHFYPHRTGRSVTGGYVYRGCLFPKLQGLYFFADFERGIIWVLREKEDGTWERLRVCMGGGGICHSGNLVGEDRARHITSFGEDENGELYILATDFPSPHSRRGAVYRIIEPERRAAPSKCA